MGVTVVQRLGVHSQPRPGRWSVAALVLAGIGVAASTSLVLVSDGDPSHVLWPLVVLPIAIAFTPLVVPRNGVRVGAAVAMGGWCVLTGFSIGFLLLPALVAQLGAAVREGEA